MYDLHLTPEQLEFRDTVRGFVEDEVKPVALNADRLDRGDRSLPMDVLRKASRIGLRTLALPEELGGAGADALTGCIVTEELAVGDADIAAVLAETAALGRSLLGAMTGAQRDRFLETFLADDDHHLAFAGGGDGVLGIDYHRPEHEARRTSFTAVRDADAFVVNGARDAVVNAPLAKLFAVEARTDRGPALLLVPRDTPGVSVAPPPEPRWYLGACGRLTLRNCRVPAGNALPDGEPSDSPWQSALNLGIGRAAYEAALEYASLRIQGGRRLIEHQAIGTKLADIAIRLDVARAVVWRAAWAADHPAAVADRSLPELPLETIARVFTSEAVYRAVKDAAECFGAMGVMRDMPLPKYLNDARICLYSGDGNADRRLRIAEGLANYRRNPATQAAE
jgi:alkylation response protein AidB-like acyl-CoA dehydrogenase